MEDRIDISGLAPEDVEYVKKIINGLKHRPKNGGSFSNGAEAARPKSELGTELRAIRQKIVESGLPLLTEEEIEKEVAERRGERNL
jgi:hypothetical protein